MTNCCAVVCGDHFKPVSYISKLLFSMIVICFHMLNNHFSIHLFATLYMPGNLLPSGSKYLQSTKMKKRKISWDMPEMGCIWFGVKYYHKLVILLQVVNHYESTDNF